MLDLARSMCTPSPFFPSDFSPLLQYSPCTETNSPPGTPGITLHRPTGEGPWASAHAEKLQRWVLGDRDGYPSIAVR